MAFTKRIKLAIISILALGIAVLIFVYFEINKSREDLLEILERESITLISTLGLSIENTIITNLEFEELIVKRLNSIAELASLAESNNLNLNTKLKEISSEFETSYLSIIDGKGKLIATTSDNPDDIHFFTDELLDELKPIIEGQYSWIDFGIIENLKTKESLYIVARERGMAPGCVIVGLNSSQLLDFRKKIGIGKKIQDIGSNPDIVYTVLQDFEGIVSASNNVLNMPAIENDEFLTKAWKKDSIMTRLFDFDGYKNGFGECLEVVKTIPFQKDEKLLLRIGLSLESINEIHSRSINRAILLGLGIFLTGLFLIGFILTRQKFEVLKQEHILTQQYTSLILNNIADAVIAINHNKKIIVFNQAAENVFSKKASDLLNKDYSKVFERDQLKIGKCFDENKVILFEELDYNLYKDNEIVDKKVFGLSVSLIKNENNDLDMAVAIIRDLTNQKKTDEQLQRKSKLTAMGELAAGVAHEIRNPLNAINIISQRFQYEFEPTEDKEEYEKLVKTIRSEVTRVNSIIKQFLDFSRPPKLNLSQYSILEALNESIAIVESQANSQYIKIIVELAKDFNWVYDKDKLKQVFLNLFNNSIEAMPNGGEIKCAIRKENDICIIKISDNGVGIPDENKSKIFDLYYTSKSTGLGLGLSIVHQIITEHNGNINFESQKGVGTTFTIILHDNFQ